MKFRRRGSWAVNVRYWPVADIASRAAHVCFRG